MAGFPSGHVVTADELGATLTSTTFAVCSADVALSQTEKVVTGLSTSINTVTAAAVVKVFVTLQIAATTGASGDNLGRLYVDGTLQTGLIDASLTATNDKGMYSRRWSITGLSAGPHTIEVRCIRSNGNGAFTVGATNSCMDIEVFE